MSKLTDFLPKTGTWAPINGVGTTGTWPISITGNATTVTDGVYLNAAQTLLNKTMEKPVIYGLIERALIMSSSNAIDVSKAAVFVKTLTGATTFTITGAPSSLNVASFILRLTNGGNYTVTWWSGVKWSGGAAPKLTSNGTDNLGFYTYDGGATWEGFLLSKDSK